MADGIVIIDKPAGWTSMDVCAKLRGILHTRKVGHAGTLDPMATGVLPVFVGRSTRGVSFAEDGEKEYVATLHLGQVTDTQDTTGETLEERPVTVSRADLELTLPRFVGEIQQIPPMYSALKVGGQKLCDLARKGVEVERKARTITIFSITLEEQLSPADYVLRVRCSKGTYIRTLCHDIGQALGCGGCMEVFAALWPQDSPSRSPTPSTMCKRRERRFSLPLTACSVSTKCTISTAADRSFAVETAIPSLPTSLTALIVSMGKTALFCV